MASQRFRIISDIHSWDGVARLMCERDKRIHDYDFNFIPNTEWRERFIECFVSKMSDTKVHRSRNLFIIHIKKFIKSLISSRFNLPLSKLDRPTLDEFFVYIHNSKLSISQKSKYCSTVLRSLRRINTLHDDSYFSIDIPQNPFIGTANAIERSTSYSAEQFDQIISALGRAMEDNPIIAFHENWFDSKKYIVGDFKDDEFRECYYINYYRTGRLIEGINARESDENVRCNFFKWNSQTYGSSKNFYNHINKNLKHYKQKYAGKMLAFFRLGAPEVFQIFLFAAIATGFNKQTLLDMVLGEWVTRHPFVPGISIIQAPKFRSKKMNQSSFAENNNSVIQILEKYERICKLIINKHHGFSKLWQIGYYNPAELLATTVDKQNRDFVRLHNLKHAIGTSTIHFRKIRATAAEQMLVKFKGDFTKLKQFLNHAKAATTYDYVEQCLDNRHIQEELSENITLMTCSFIGLNGNSDKEQLKSHLNVDDQTADALIAGYFDTPFARCKNPYHENNDTKKRQICSNFDLLRCFTCNNIVIFPEDLYKLFSYSNLKKEQLLSGTISDETYSFYTPLIDFIEHSIASRFEDSDVQAMRTKAATDPYYVHP